MILAHRPKTTRNDYGGPTFMIDASFTLVHLLNGVCRYETNYRGKVLKSPEFKGADNQAAINAHNALVRKRIKAGEQYLENRFAPQDHP